MAALRPVVSIAPPANGRRGGILRPTSHCASICLQAPDRERLIPGVSRVHLKQKVGDIEVFYSPAGEGRPVVLIHGLGEDHRSWSAQQEALCGYATFAIDLRGHGQTTLGRAEGTLAQLGQDLTGFLESVTGPAACVGFSLGGTIVLWAAANRPDLVPYPIVIGTSSVVGRAAAAYYRSRIELVQRSERQELAGALRRDTQSGISRPGVDVEALARRRIDAVGDGGGYANAAAAMAGIHEEPLTPLLKQIRQHVLVVGGEMDTFCPRKAADIMMEALTDATFEEIPGAGHLMNVEAPEAVTGVIYRYLQGRGY